MTPVNFPLIRGAAHGNPPCDETAGDRLCVSTICGMCGSESCLAEVCSKLNLQVQKAKRALRPGSSLVRHARQVFLRVFLLLKASPSLLPEGYFPRRSLPTRDSTTHKTPHDIPYALFETQLSK